MTAKNFNGLLEFSGENLGKNSRTHHQPLVTTRHYGTDFSGRVSYKFNDLGFRGEEFRPNAKFHVFVCGPSEGAGVGLNDSETWYSKVKQDIAKIKNLPLEDINLMNFSQAGASTDYVIRVLIAQANCFKPDLIIACPGAKNRIEYTDHFSATDSDRITVNINPHLNHLLTENRNLPTGNKLSQLSNFQLDQLTRITLGYYHYYTPEIGTMNQLRNYLTLQNYCKNNNIPYLIWTLARYSVETGYPHGLPLNLRTFAQSIDLQHTLKLKLRKPYDFAADRIHPGRNSNLHIAKAISNKLLMENLIC